MAEPKAAAKAFPPGAKCAVCQELLGLRAIHTGGEYYHRDCFKCASCGQLLGIRFLSVEGKQFCYTCYMNNFADRCAECNKPLVGTLCVVMLDKQYHRDCPKCAKCRRSLAGGQFFPFENQAYCLERHWQQRTEATKAPTAKKPTAEPKSPK